MWALSVEEGREPIWREGSALVVQAALEEGPRAVPEGQGEHLLVLGAVGDQEVQAAPVKASALPCVG